MKATLWVPERPAELPTRLPMLERYYDWHVRHRDAPMDLDDDNRRRYNIGLGHVKYPRWTAAFDYAWQVLQEPRTDSKLFCVGGPARSGKTAFAIRLGLELCERDWRTGRDYLDGDRRHKIIPVVCVKAPTSEIKDLARVLLASLGIPPRRLGMTANEMLDQFAEECHTYGVRLVIIDDVHNASARRAGMVNFASSKFADMVNFLKRVVDLVPAIVLFTALDFDQSPLCNPMLVPEGELRDLLAQLHERKETFEFPAVDADDVDARLMLRDAIHSQAVMLRLSNQAGSDLLESPALTLLFNQSLGKIGAALDLVARTAYRAVGQTERVGFAELESASLSRKRLSA